MECDARERAVEATRRVSRQIAGAARVSYGIANQGCDLCTQASASDFMSCDSGVSARVRVYRKKISFIKQCVGSSWPPALDSPRSGCSFALPCMYTAHAPSCYAHSALPIGRVACRVAPPAHVDVLCTPAHRTSPIDQPTRRGPGPGQANFEGRLAIYPVQSSVPRHATASLRSSCHAKMPT